MNQKPKPINYRVYKINKKIILNLFMMIESNPKLIEHMPISTKKSMIVKFFKNDIIFTSTAIIIFKTKNTEKILKNI